jgi:hypothetical protein
VLERLAISSQGRLKKASFLATTVDDLKGGNELDSAGSDCRLQPVTHPERFARQNRIGTGKRATGQVSGL